MSLTFEKSPEGGAELVASTLAQFSDLDSATGGKMSGPGTGVLSRRSLSPAQRVFALPVEDVAAGKGVEAARPIAWRYLVLEDDSAVEAAELTGDTTGELRFSSVSSGPQITGFVDAVRVAEEIAVDADYEARFLRIPAIHVSAVWLKSPTSGEDKIVPVAPVVEPLRPNRPYTAADFVEALVPAAKRCLEYSREADTRGG